MSHIMITFLSHEPLLPLFFLLLNPFLSLSTSLSCMCVYIQTHIHIQAGKYPKFHIWKKYATFVFLSLTCFVNRVISSSIQFLADDMRWSEWTMVPQRLRCLNSGPLVDGAVWGGCRTFRRDRLAGGGTSLVVGFGGLESHPTSS